MRLNKSHLKWFSAIGFLFAAIVFLWMILTPSLSSNPFLLSYSFNRFILIAATGIVLFALFLGLVCYENKSINNIFRKLMLSNAVFLFSYITTLITIIIITGVLLQAFGDRNFFFRRLLPITLLCFMFSVEVITFQKYIRNEKIWRSVWSVLGTSIHSIIQKFTRGAKTIEIILLIGLCIYTIFNWLNQLYLLPDSTNYITSSINLVKTGRLFVNTNWPSLSMEPVFEPYTDYAPGFPYFLAPFIMIFKNPILAAIIAQSIVILLFYLMIYSATKLLGFRSIFRISTLLLFTFLHTFRSINSTFLTEPLYIVLSLGIGMCVVQMIQKGFKNKFWILGFVLLALASSIKFVGISNIAWFIPILVTGFLSQNEKSPQWNENGEYAIRYSKFNYFILAIAVLVFAVAPVGLWFLRNNLNYGKITESHELFESGLQITNIMTPFNFAYENLYNIRLFPQWQLILLLFIILLTPFYVSSKRKRLIHLTLISAVLFQFLGVWVPSLVAYFNTIDDRLLSPSIAMGLLAIVYGLNCLSDHFQTKKTRYIVMSLPFLFLILSNHISVIKIEEVRSTIPNYPGEMYLWQNIRRLDKISTSSHFYTDYNFRHQIFSGIPQRILWHESVDLEDSLAVRNLLNRDKPFILLSQESQENKIIESHIVNGRLPLKQIDYDEFGFVLYYPVQ